MRLTPVYLKEFLFRNRLSFQLVYEVTCRNKKQAKTMLCMAVMQQLYKEGFVEKYGERALRPPKVKRLSAEDGGFTENIDIF